METRATRRGVAAWIVAALVTVAFVAQAPPCGEGQEGGPSALPRPNIIVVLTDDLDLELGTVDSMETLRTQVAEMGITLTDFLVPLSLCCPSRTTILRGQFPHNHEILTNSPPGGGFEKAHDLNLETATIATALQSSGTGRP